MAIAQNGEEGAQAAETDFEVLAQSDEAALLRLSPKTGRTHQLRVHCAHVFGGIFGDAKYGEARHQATGLRLHAWQAHFHHPETGEAMALEAPLSEDFAQHLDRLGLTLPLEWSPV